MIFQYWFIALLFHIFSFASTSASSPEGTATFLCDTLLCNDYFSLAASGQKARTFSDWEPVQADEPGQTDSSTASSTEAPKLSESSSAASGTVLDFEEFAFRVLDEILAAKCWSDLKLWLRKYPFAKAHFEELGVSLTDLMADFEFDCELIGLILAQVIDDSVDHWLILLRLVDFFLLNSHPEAIGCVLERAIALGKSEKHFSTLFYRILQGASLVIDVKNLSCRRRKLSAYQVLAPLAGTVAGFPGHEKLFQSTLRGQFSSFEVKKLFFFAPSIQRQLINAYFANDGYFSRNGLVPFNLLQIASQYAWDAAALELVLDRINVSKLDFDEFEYNMRGDDDGTTETEFHLNAALRCAMDRNQPRQAELLVTRVPELFRYVDCFIESLPFEDIISDPFWIQCIHRLELSKCVIRLGCFGELEFLALCGLKKDEEERKRSVSKMLTNMSPALMSVNTKLAYLTKAATMALKYSIDENYGWAEDIFKELGSVAPEELLKLFDDAKAAQNQTQIKFLGKLILE